MASYPETDRRKAPPSSGGPGGRSEGAVRILGFGTYDRDRHPRVGILLEGLRALGEDVVELNAPLGFSTAERVAMLGKPWLAHRMATRLARRWAALVRGWRRLDRPPPDAVVVGYLGHFDVGLARMLFPRTVIALDLLIFAADTARDRGASGGLKLRLLGALDAVAVRCASVVILDTDEHLSLVPERQRNKAVVIPVGAPDYWFAAPRAEADDGTDTEPTAKPDAGPLRVIFFGLYTPLQGTPTIGAAIAQLAPDCAIEFTMIGSGQDLAETKRLAGARPGVRWLDWVEPAELPQLVHEHDVCLGIFGGTDKALRVTPNKVFQGAAAGCAIVTSDTAPQRRALGDSACFVPPADPAALARELTRLAGDRTEVQALREAAYRRADENFRGSKLVAPLLAALREKAAG
ncbi:MAG: hypothetical protein JWO63_2658 [Frankiales bacterium]|nr:hypothetical protein [Frankiales bacterium]